MVALPKITYGLAAWYLPPNKQEGKTKQSGSTTILRNLQKIQRMATLAITRTLRMSPNDFLDMHTNILPMELALKKNCHSAVIQLLTLPATNPIHYIIQNIRLFPPKKHFSPLFTLLKIFKLTNLHIETIILTTNLLTHKIRCHTQIDNTRKDSIKTESNDNTDYRIFSDGSCYNNGIGVAAVLFANRHSSVKELQKYLGPPEDHTTYKAKIAGAILALWIIDNTLETIGKKVSLYIHNQALILVIKTPSTTSGQHLKQSLIHAINTTTYNLSIKWISSHSNVPGNEKADQLAKKVLSSKTCTRQLLATP